MTRLRIEIQPRNEPNSLVVSSTSTSSAYSPSSAHQLTQCHANSLDRMAPKTLLPSKGALRALRHLAIGGITCTVAFSTVVLTEERRRRIRAAQVALENGRLLRAISRAQYSAAVDAAFDTEEKTEFPPVFSDQPPEEVPWHNDVMFTGKLPDASRDEVDAPQRIDGSKHPGFLDLDVPIEDKTIEDKGSLSPGDPYRQRGEFSSLHNKRTFYTPVTTGLTSKRQALASAGSLQRWSILQSQISQVVRENLERTDMDNAEAVKAAAEFYLRQFPPAWQPSTLDTNLVGVASKLSNACVRHQLMSTAVRVLEILLCSPIDEDSFMSFFPDIMIHHLLASDATKKNERKRNFVRAVKLFCVELKNEIRSRYPDMATAAGKLCEQAFQRKDYHLVEKIYWRSQAWCPESNVIDTDKLYLTFLALKKHKEVAKLSLRLLPLVRTNFKEFLTLVRTATESAYCIRNKQEREESLEAILKVAADLSGNRKIPSSLLSRALGDHWRTTRDFTTSQAQFERLKRYTHAVRHPVVLYRAMIQICVEANQNHQIPQYFEAEKLCECDIGCRGHLAHGKAKLGQWEGVEEEFKVMRYIVCGNAKRQQAFNSSFPPILKVFSEHHSVTQTEEFLRRCVDLYGIEANQFVSNLMVSLYANAGELDTIPIWGKYARSKGLSFTATTFNAMLSVISRTRNNARLYDIYEQVRALNVSFVDKITLRIVSKADKIARRLLRLRRARWIRKRLQTFEANDGRDWRSIKHAMTLAMSNDEFDKALNIYWSARDDDTHLPPSVLDLAIASVYRGAGEGQEEQVHDLLQDAQRSGQDVTWALPNLLVHRLRDAKRSGAPVARIMRDAQARLAARGLLLPLAAVTEATAILVQRGHFAQAVELWHALSRGDAGEALYALDLAILSVLMKAYVSLHDCHGIRWVVRSLEAHEIRADPIFRRFMKDALKEIEARVAACASDAVPAALAEVRTVLAECLRGEHEYGVARRIRARSDASEKVLAIMRDAALAARARDEAAKDEGAR